MAKRLCLALLTVGLFAARVAAQEARQLEPGTAVERELAGGESHAFQVVLTAGQFVRFRLEQRGKISPELDPLILPGVIQLILLERRRG